MSITDIILLVLLGAFVLHGLWFGFIRTLGNAVGLIVGAFVASQYVGTAVDYLGFIFNNNTTVAGVVLFLLILVIVQRLVCFIFWIIDKLFGFLKWLPFVGFVNRLLGGLLGAVEGFAMLAAGIYFIQIMFPSWATAWFSGSQIVSYVTGVTTTLHSMVPWI